MPGLRRLRHPASGAAADARTGGRAPQHRVRVGDRVQQPIPVLHEHLRVPRDPWPCSGHRHRARHRPSRPRCVGHHRRRRRALDRWQPPHPRTPAKRQPHDPAVQQPDLRTHQGPVLADLGVGEGHQVDADRLDRPTVQSAQRRPRRRGIVRCSHPRSRSQAHDGSRSAPHTIIGAGPSSRSTRTATCSTTTSSTASPSARTATRT